MKFKKVTLVMLILLVFLTIGAVSASTDADDLATPDVNGDTTNNPDDTGTSDNSPTILKETQKTTTGNEDDSESEEENEYDVTTTTVENWEENRDTNFINISTPKYADKTNRIIVTKEVEEGDEPPVLFNNSLDERFWSNDNKTETEDKTIYLLSISDLSYFDDYLYEGFLPLKFRITDSTEETELLSKTINFYEEDGNFIAREDNGEDDWYNADVNVGEDGVVDTGDGTKTFATLSIPDDEEDGNLPNEFIRISKEGDAEAILFEKGLLSFIDPNREDGRATFSIKLSELDSTIFQSLQNEDLIKFALLDEDDNELYSALFMLMDSNEGNKTFERYEPIDEPKFDRLLSGDEEDDSIQSFEREEEATVSYIYLPNNEETYTPITITVYQNDTAFLSQTTPIFTELSDLEYDKAKEAYKYPLTLNLTKFMDKDIIKFNIGEDEWTYAIQIDGDNIIFHYYEELEGIEFYVFYGNLTTGDLNDPQSMGPHPHGNFICLETSEALSEGTLNVKKDNGETILTKPIQISEFKKEYNYNILGYEYVIKLDDEIVSNLTPVNENLTFILSFGDKTITKNVSL